MLPNWDLDFSGLSNMPLFKKRFRAVSLRHAYRATYTVGSYISNYDFNMDIAHAMNFARDLQNNFIPRNDIASVNLQENFSPLIGIDMKFLNSLDAGFRMNKGRNITLGLGNLQMNESNTSEYVISTGYIFSDVSLIIRTPDGNRRALNSDLKVQADFTIRDNKTLIRRIGEIDDTEEIMLGESSLPVQASAGQNQMSFKMSANYNISSNFSITLFFDRIINTPFVSTAYKTYNTNFGFTIRFMLVQ